MSQERAEAFAATLQELERDGDVDRFVQTVFTGDVELLRPELAQALIGGDGARTFWQHYLGQFAEVGSTFERVIGVGDHGVLEWTSGGRRTGGAPISYRGVSLLDFDDDGRVRRFATYFDTAAFLAPASGAIPS